MDLQGFIATNIVLVESLPLFRILDYFIVTTF